HHGRDFVVRRPDVAQVDGVTIAVDADRLEFPVDVPAPGKGVSYDQGRRGEVVRADLGMDSPLEVTIARQNRGHDETTRRDPLRDAMGKGPAVADTRGTPVPA